MILGRGTLPRGGEAAAIAAGAADPSASDSVSAAWRTLLLSALYWIPSGNHSHKYLPG